MWAWQQHAGCANFPAARDSAGTKTKAEPRLSEGTEQENAQKLYIEKGKSFNSK